MPYENLALKYERKFPQINNHLINTISIIKKADLYPKEFIERLKLKTYEILKYIRMEKSVENKRIKEFLKIISLLLLLFIILTSLFPSQIKKGFNKIFMVSNASYIVEPGNCKVLKGKPLEIRFYEKGIHPVEIELKNEFKKEKLPMKYEKYFYSYFIEKVEIPFFYRILSPEAITPWYNVEVSEETNIEKILLILKYPSYTKRPPEKKEIEFGSFDVLKNTEIEMEFIFNNRVGDTYLILSNGKIFNIKGTSNKKRFKFIVDQPLIYRVKFYDLISKNFISTPDNKIDIDFDNSPFVEILEPGRDIYKKGGESVKIKVLIDDDFGIKEIKFKMNSFQNEIGKNDITFYQKNFTSNVKKEIIETFLTLPQNFKTPIYYYVECNDNSYPSSNKGISSVYYIYPYEGRIKEIKKELFSEKDEEIEKLKKKKEEIFEKIKEFVEKEEEVLKAEKRIEKINDLNDKKEINEIIDIQSDYLKTFQKMLNDLNKIGKQTEGKFTLSEEFVEMLSHIQKSIENLKKNEIHMAIKESQMGLELAKEITSNLERWLAEGPDNIKWDLEEPSKKYEVPEVELPEELEDIIGELIEKEEEMREEIEDLTSSWMDSLDKGAGWGVSDGPISNMSAKGITGNLMPNQQEIGGRSGEGRTGRSYGEMVEKTATGKGGRKTPARLTPDNFEPGEIIDKSKENPLGPTGGGKISGWGEQGLSGIQSDNIYRYDALLRKQKEIIDKAEKILLDLKSVNIYNPQLEKAISQMKKFQIQLKEGKYNELLKTKTEIISNLREFSQSLLRKELIKGEKIVKKREEKKISDDFSFEKIPEGYEEIVMKYFYLNLK